MGISAAERGSLNPGERFGVYRVVREIGRGSYGAVFEAQREPIGRRVALKVLHAAVQREGPVVARFVREATIAASLKHPHIVDVEDFGEVDGLSFLVMEYLEGQSLDEALDEQGRLPTERALELLLPVFSAVAAIHDRGVVHRDLKPQNIFLWRSVAGQVQPKLLDFGVAKALEADPMAEMTATGTQMGTPLYMSPEQWRSARGATPQSDQWALAVILFRCLTGAHPFEGNSLPALVTKVTLDAPTPLRAVLPDAPEALEAAILRALEKRPEDRHDSVRAFGRALLGLASTGTQERWAAEFGAERPAVVANPALSETLPAPLADSLTPVTARRQWLQGGLAAATFAVALGVSSRWLATPTVTERPGTVRSLTPAPLPEVHPVSDVPPPVDAQSARDVTLTSASDAPVDAPSTQPRNARRRRAHPEPPPPSAPNI